MWTLYGDCKGSSGVKKAARLSVIRNTSASIATFFRRNRRQASAASETPRIERASAKSLA